MAMTKQVAYERSLANLPRTYKVEHSCRSECIFELRYEMPWQVLFCDTHLDFVHYEGKQSAYSSRLNKRD